MKTSVNIKMEVEDRDAAKKLFDSLGLDMTTAVNLFVKASLREQAIPFRADPGHFQEPCESEMPCPLTIRRIEEGSELMAHRSLQQCLRLAGQRDYRVLGCEGTDMLEGSCP